MYKIQQYLKEGVINIEAAMKIAGTLNPQTVFTKSMSNDWTIRMATRLGYLIKEANLEVMGSSKVRYLDSIIADYIKYSSFANYIEVQPQYLASELKHARTNARPMSKIRYTYFVRQVRSYIDNLNSKVSIL